MKMSHIKIKSSFVTLIILSLFIILIGNATRTNAYYNIFGYFYSQPPVGGLYGTSILSDILTLYNLPAIGNSLIPSLSYPIPGPATITTVTAEQAGFFEGYWISILKSQAGLMNIDLVENPVSGEISGTCNMILNKFISGPVEVSGILNPETATYILSGTYFDFSNLINYILELDCTYTDPDSLNGQYVIHDAFFTKVDFGVFELSLGSPSITSPTTLLPISTLPILSSNLLLTSNLLTTGLGLLTGLLPTITPPTLSTLAISPLTTVQPTTILQPVTASPAVTSGIFFPY
ncbi:MAG: hypothetical protein ACMUJM_13860 [bacterium]